MTKTHWRENQPISLLKKLNNICIRNMKPTHSLNTKEPSTREIMDIPFCGQDNENTPFETKSQMTLGSTHQSNPNYKA